MCLELQNCKTAAAAKKMLAERGVAHYWDLAQAQTPNDD